MGNDGCKLGQLQKDQNLYEEKEGEKCILCKSCNLWFSKYRPNDL